MPAIAKVVTVSVFKFFHYLEPLFSSSFFGFVCLSFLGIYMLNRISPSPSGEIHIHMFGGVLQVLLCLCSFLKK